VGGPQRPRQQPHPVPRSEAKPRLWRCAHLCWDSRGLRPPSIRAGSRQLGRPAVVRWARLQWLCNACLAWSAHDRLSTRLAMAYSHCMHCKSCAIAVLLCMPCHRETHCPVATVPALPACLPVRPGPAWPGLAGLTGWNVFPDLAGIVGVAACWRRWPELLCRSHLVPGRGAPAGKHDADDPEQKPRKLFLRVVLDDDRVVGVCDHGGQDICTHPAHPGNHRLLADGGR